MAEKFRVRMRCSEYGVYRDLAESHVFSHKQRALDFQAIVNKSHEGLSPEVRDKKAYLVYAQDPERV